MLNVYVHLDVRCLPASILDDDRFLRALWRELPDAAPGGHDGVVSITLSQYALNRRTAARRQLNRVRAALRALGLHDADPVVTDTVREGLRDDIDCLVHAVRWHLAR